MENTLKNDPIQKALSAEYRQILEQVWNGDAKMVDFCVKKAERYVPVTGGFITLKKPGIQKDFCFGYQSSAGSTEEYDRANSLADYASRSQAYFISENLRDIDREIREIRNGADIALRKRYGDRQKSGRYLELVFLGPCERCRDSMDRVNETDRKAILEAMEGRREAFILRLNAYLKRYGMRHVNSWSYCMDA